MKLAVEGGEGEGAPGERLGTSPGSGPRGRKLCDQDGSSLPAQLTSPGLKNRMELEKSCCFDAAVYGQSAKAGGDAC